jgi:hypothetical protein
VHHGQNEAGQQWQNDASLYAGKNWCMFGAAMKRNCPVFMLGLIASLVAGCSSSQMSRIDRNRELYETWPIDTREAVLAGRVEPGMTPDMVRVAWGEPSEVVVQSNTGDEIWVYKRGGDPGSPVMSGGMGGTSMGGVGVGVGGGGGSGVRMGAGVGSIGGMSGPSGGMGAPIMTAPTPPEIREVVFRDGVVRRADKP